MDQAHLAADRLADILGLDAFRPGFRQRLINLFRDAVEQQLPICLGDGGAAPQQRQRAAHALKGAAGGIGAIRLQALAQTLEQTCAESVPDASEAQALRAEAAEALRLLDAWSAACVAAEVAEQTREPRA
jgi:HPt (histidine-containing phosphotransfer) domain-containing protein